MMHSTKKNMFTDGIEKHSMPLYTIGVVAQVIGTTNRTLRLYEKHGLINPTRKNKNRFYSENNIRWLLCLRSLIHEKKISIEGIKKLLEYAPCWEINDCPDDLREGCAAYKDTVTPCWEINRLRCRRSPDICEKCSVFLSKSSGKMTSQASATESD